MFYKTKIIESQKYSWGSETMIWPHTVCTVLIPALIIHLKILLDSGWLSYSACRAKKCRMSVKVSEYSKMEVLLMETPQRGAQNKMILSMLHVGHERGWNRQYHKVNKDSKEHKEEKKISISCLREAFLSAEEQKGRRGKLTCSLLKDTKEKNESLSQFLDVLKKKVNLLFPLIIFSFIDRSFSYTVSFIN